MYSKKVITIFIFSFCLFGCIFSFSQKRAEKIREEKILEDWKSDTLGCFGYRNSEKACYLRDSLGLMNKSKAFVLKKIGVPNFTQKNDDDEVFKYYFNGICREGVLIDSADYCWLELLIISDKVEYIGISCY